MATLREKQTLMRVFTRRLMLAGLCLLVVFAASGAWGIYRKSRDSAILRDEAISQLDDLQEQQAQLTASIGTLQTARGREAALRQQYNMGHAGENIIQIVEPDEPASTTATTSTIHTWVQHAFSWW